LALAALVIFALPTLGTPGPAPAVRSISPPSHQVGRFTVDIYGTNFQQGARVLLRGNGWSGESLQVRYANSGYLQAVVELNAGGAVTLVVRNPDGQISNGLMLQVAAVNTPPSQSPHVVPAPARAAPPTLTNTNPNSHQAGRFDVDLYGNNFQNGARVVVSGNGRSDQNSQILFANAGHLQAALDLSIPGAYSLSIRNPDGQLSNPVVLQVVGATPPLQRQPTPGNPPVPVRAPAPSLRNLASSNHAAGNFTLDLYGANFQAGARVEISASGRTEQIPEVLYDNAGHLRAAINLNTAGAFSVAVRNPDGQLSNPVALQVTALNTAPAQPAHVPTAARASAPALQSVSPTSHAAGNFTVELYGSNFQAASKVVVTANGRSSDSSVVKFDSTGHLQVTLDVGTPGGFTLAVRNPDGQASNSLALQVTSTNSLAPSSTQACSYADCESKFGLGQCTDYIRTKLGAMTPTGEGGVARCWPVDDKVVRPQSVAVLALSDFGHVAWVESVSADHFVVTEWNNGRSLTDSYSRCCARTTNYRQLTTSQWKITDPRIIGFYHPELHQASVKGSCAAADAMMRSHPGAILPSNSNSGSQSASPAAVPANVAEIQSWRTRIDHQVAIAMVLPPFNGDWQSLLTMKLTNTLDRYEDLYLAAVSRRSVAVDYMIAAKKFLGHGDIANTKKYFDKGLRLSSDSEELMKAAISVYEGGISTAYTVVNAIYLDAKQLSLALSLACGSYACYEVLNSVYMISDYAVDSSQYSPDIANRNLVVKAISEAILSQLDLSGSVTHLVGQPASTHVIVDQILHAPNFRSQIMRFVGRSAGNAADQLGEKVISELILHAQEMNQAAGQVQFAAPQSASSSSQH